IPSRCAIRQPRTSPGTWTATSPGTGQSASLPRMMKAKGKPAASPARNTSAPCATRSDWSRRGTRLRRRRLALGRRGRRLRPARHEHERALQPALRPLHALARGAVARVRRVERAVLRGGGGDLGEAGLAAGDPVDERLRDRDLVRRGELLRRFVLL